MKSPQMGAALSAPGRSRWVLSSNPTHTTHSSSAVNPANHPSRKELDVPVLPAAGAVKLYLGRMPAPVPLRSTSSIRLVTR